MTEINKIKSEHSSSQKNIKSLEIKVDYLERNMKSATLEISNLPSLILETRQTLTKIGVSVNQTLEDTDIKSIFRSKARMDSVGVVHVEFSSTSRKDQFLLATKNYNKLNKMNRLNTTILQEKGPHKPIYVSEAL